MPQNYKSFLILNSVASKWLTTLGEWLSISEEGDTILLLSELGFSRAIQNRNKLYHVAIHVEIVSFCHHYFTSTHLTFVENFRLQAFVMLLSPICLWYNFKEVSMMRYSKHLDLSWHICIMIVERSPYSCTKTKYFRKCTVKSYSHYCC